MKCQKICQIECQIDCQIECQVECQDICQIECQNICQNICQIGCQNILNICPNLRPDMSWWGSHEVEYFFSDRSFSGCVFPDYFLFRRCLFRLYPFQALSCYTISFSTCAFADYILLRKKNWKSHFFFSASLTWIYETTDIKRKKHMRHPDINIYETLVGTVFQQVS